MSTNYRATVLGIFVAMEPDMMISSIIPPGTYPMQNYIAVLATIDLIGLFVGIPLLSWAHANHLAGLGIGIAYIYYDGKEHMWQPSRKLAFNCMKRLHMV